jgi:hypothetical protein
MNPPLEMKKQKSSYLITSREIISSIHQAGWYLTYVESIGVEHDVELRKYIKKISSPKTLYNRTPTERNIEDAKSIVLLNASTNYERIPNNKISEAKSLFIRRSQKKPRLKVKCNQWSNASERIMASTTEKVESSKLSVSEELETKNTLHYKNQCFILKQTKLFLPRITPSTFYEDIAIPKVTLKSLVQVPKQTERIKTNPLDTRRSKRKLNRALMNCSRSYIQQSKYVQYSDFSPSFSKEDTILTIALTKKDIQSGKKNTSGRITDCKWLTHHSPKPLAFSSSLDSHQANSSDLEIIKKFAPSPEFYHLIVETSVDFNKNTESKPTSVPHSASTFFWVKTSCKSTKCFKTLTIQTNTSSCCSYSESKDMSARKNRRSNGNKDFPESEKSNSPSSSKSSKRGLQSPEESAAATKLIKNSNSPIDNAIRENAENSDMDISEGIKTPSLSEYERKFEEDQNVLNDNALLLSAGPSANATIIEYNGENFLNYSGSSIQPDGYQSFEVEGVIYEDRNIYEAHCGNKSSALTRENLSINEILEQNRILIDRNARMEQELLVKKNLETVNQKLQEEVKKQQSLAKQIEEKRQTMNALAASSNFTDTRSRSSLSDTKSLGAIPKAPSSSSTGWQANKKPMKAKEDELNFTIRPTEYPEVIINKECMTSIENILNTNFDLLGGKQENVKLVPKHGVIIVTALDQFAADIIQEVVGMVNWQVEGIPQLMCVSSQYGGLMPVIEVWTSKKTTLSEVLMHTKFLKGVTIGDSDAWKLINSINAKQRIGSVHYFVCDNFTKNKIEESEGGNIRVPSTKSFNMTVALSIPESYKQGKISSSITFSMQNKHDFSFKVKKPPRPKAASQWKALELPYSVELTPGTPRISLLAWTILGFQMTNTNDQPNHLAHALISFHLEFTLQYSHSIIVTLNSNSEISISHFLKATRVDLNSIESVNLYFSVDWRVSNEFIKISQSKLDSTTMVKNVILKIIMSMNKSIIDSKLCFVIFSWNLLFPAQYYSIIACSLKKKTMRITQSIVKRKASCHEHSQSIRFKHTHMNCSCVKQINTRTPRIMRIESFNIAPRFIRVDRFKPKHLRTLSKDHG